GADTHVGEEDEAAGVATRPRQAAAPAAPERRAATRTEAPVVAEDHPQSLGTSRHRAPPSNRARNSSGRGASKSLETRIFPASAPRRRAARARDAGTRRATARP